MQVAEAGSGFRLTDTNLNRRGTVFVCSTHQTINRGTHGIEGTVNRGGERANVGFETCDPARL